MSALLQKYSFPLVLMKIACDFTNIETRKQECKQLYWSWDTTLLNFIKKLSSLTSSKAELPDAVTKEVNNAMKIALDKERNEASGRN